MGGLFATSVPLWKVQSVRTWGVLLVVNVIIFFRLLWPVTWPLFRMLESNLSCGHSCVCRTSGLRFFEGAKDPNLFLVLETAELIHETDCQVSMIHHCSSRVSSVDGLHLGAEHILTAGVQVAEV